MIAAVNHMLPWVGWLVALVVSVRLDGLFCGLETGIYVLNKHRLDLHAEAGVQPALFLQKMLSDPDRLLATLLLGTNLLRYLATFAISAMFVLAGYETKAEWFTMAVATPLLFLASDSIPKTVFQRSEPQRVYRLVWLLKASYRIFRLTGLLWMVNGMAKTLAGMTAPIRSSSHALGGQSLSAMVDEGLAGGVLTAFQSAMANRVVRIGQVTVADAMVPIRRVVKAGSNASDEELLAIIRQHNYSRIPMVEANGNVTGILDVYDLLAKTGHRRNTRATRPLVLPAGMTVTDALHRMRRAREAMAVVANASRHVGIVTIKDLVEEIVGELESW